MGQPDIIFLNGASSSGKTTLGRVLQRKLVLPYFYFSSDQLVEASVLPDVDRDATEGEKAWSIIRPRFFDAFHKCIAAMASPGNRVIVEHVLEIRSWYDDCVNLLAPFDVFYVGVHCPLSELERRERTRGNRTFGEGRSHLEDGVHTWGPYDLEVDTSLGTPEQNADLVMKALSSRNRHSDFCRT